LKGDKKRMANIIMAIILAIVVLIILILINRRWRFSPFLKMWRLGVGYGLFCIILIGSSISENTVFGIVALFSLIAGGFGHFFTFVVSGGKAGPSDSGLEPMLADALKLKEIEAKVIKAPAPNFWTLKAYSTDTVQLTNQNINQISVIAGFTAGGMGGGMDTVGYEKQISSELRITVFLENRLSEKVREAITASLHIIGRNITLGLPNGEVTDIKWNGGQITELLDQDKEIKETLLNMVKRAESFKTISIEKGNKTSVHVRLLFETQVPEEAISVISDHFSAYDKIAKHIREVVSTY